MVTHDPNAASYADRVIFLADGKIVDEMRGPDRRLGARPHEAARGLTDVQGRDEGRLRPQGTAVPHRARRDRGDGLPVLHVHLLGHDPGDVQQPLRRRLQEHRRVRPVLQQDRGGFRRRAAGPHPRQPPRRGEGGRRREGRAGRRHGLRADHRQGRQTGGSDVERTAQLRRRGDDGRAVTVALHRGQPTGRAGSGRDRQGQRRLRQARRGRPGAGHLGHGSPRVHPERHRQVRRRGLARWNDLRPVRPPDRARSSSASPDTSTPSW